MRQVARCGGSPNQPSKVAADRDETSQYRGMIPWRIRLSVLTATKRVL